LLASVSIETTHSDLSDAGRLRATQRGRAVVKSTNFEFLRPKHYYLADLGGFAEQYLHSDPPSSLIKLRTFAEMMVNDVYAAYGLHQPFEANLNDLLLQQPFKDSVPGPVLAKLHVLRKHGNQAAHGQQVTQEMARRTVQADFQL